MSDAGYHVDTSAADQVGLGLLAEGDDLFDLGHLPAAVTAPAWAMEPNAGHHTGLDADLVAMDLLDQSEPSYIGDGHIGAGHASYLQLAGLDQAPLIFPLPQPTTADQAGQDQTGHGPAVSGAVDHAPALSLHDILADAANDLASFQTAAGGTGGGHAPMGSGLLFEQLHSAPSLGGFSEMHAITFS
jgi:hypothetical protein